MRIRLAGLADLPQALALGRAMHAESRFRAYPMNVDKTQDLFRAFISHPASACVLLAEHPVHGLAGMLAGHVTELFFADVRVAQDKWFFVQREFRGSSAALKLLMAFRRWAENRQARELNINMSVDIEPERFNRFMQHLEFKSCGSNFTLSLQ